MKSVFATAAAAALLAGSAGASTIYSNGPGNGNVIGWTINFGFSVADSFTGAGVANGMTFETWDLGTNDTPSSVTWTITSGNPLSGGTFTTLGTGTASISAVSLGANTFGFDLFADTISFTGVTLTGGNYWIELSGAADGGGNPVYWDDNGGPSDAWENTLGDLSLQPGGIGSNSETFSILGTVPDPATWAMMLAGFAGLGAALRSRRKLATG